MRRYSDWREAPPNVPMTRSEKIVAWSPLVWFFTVGGIFAYLNPILLTLGMTGASFFLGGWGVAKRRRRQLLAQLDGEPDDLAVSASYSTGGKHGDDIIGYGGDEGLLAHVDGWLVFRGLRTEWAVRTTDVNVSGRTLRFDGPAGRHGVALSTQSSSEPTLQLFINGEKALNRVVQEWEAHDVPKLPIGEEVRFPPVVPTPPGKGWSGDVPRWVGVLVGVIVGVVLYFIATPWIGGIIGGVIVIASFVIDTSSKEKKATLASLASADPAALKDGHDLRSSQGNVSL